MPRAAHSNVRLENQVRVVCFVEALGPKFGGLAEIMLQISRLRGGARESRRLPKGERSVRWTVLWCAFTGFF